MCLICKEVTLPPHPAQILLHCCLFVEFQIGETQLTQLSCINPYQIIGVRLSFFRQIQVVDFAWNVELVVLFVYLQLQSLLLTCSVPNCRTLQLVQNRSYYLYSNRQKFSLLKLVKCETSLLVITPQRLAHLSVPIVIRWSFLFGHKEIKQFIKIVFLIKSLHLADQIVKFIGQRGAIYPQYSCESRRSPLKEISLIDLQRFYLIDLDIHFACQIRHQTQLHFQVLSLSIDLAMTNKAIGQMFAHVFTLNFSFALHFGCYGDS